MTDYREPERIVWRGDAAWRYRAAALEVVVLPDRGGKIASLRQGGTEWLTQPRRPLLPLDHLPDRLVEGDMFGWDECAPTIDDCEVLGRPLPLHGEVWNQRWTDLGNGWLSVRGRRFDYRLSRRLTVRPDGFRLDYGVTAGERMPFLWAAHPQFAATGATRVILGDGTAPLVDIFDRGYWRDRPGDAPLRLSDLPSGGSGKLFVAPGQATSRASLVQPDDRALTFTWDSTTAPYLGVWMDRAGIGPVEAIAVEPMTGYADSCAGAAAAGRILWLEAGRAVSWWLDVHVATPPGPPAP